MAERTRRATEAVDAQATYIETCLEGSDKAMLEGVLLDPTLDPNDPRYGHGDFLYGKGNSFQDWAKEMSGGAMTYTATSDLFREILLTMEMMDEEGLSFLPLLERHVPSKRGFFLFPYGVKNPWHVDGGRTLQNIRGSKYYVDDGCGTEHWVDGFMWEVSNRVAADGHAGTPKPGLSIILLTRFRGDPEHRPFRPLHGRYSDESLMRFPELVGSDLTAWAFDEAGQQAWTDPKLLVDIHQRADHPTMELSEDELRVALEGNRWWVRSLVWATLRWTTEELWLDEEPERAARRRLSRARPVLHEHTPEDGRIVIVDLRPERKEAVARGESDGEPPWWRSRWTVRGHWAKRRYAIRDEAGNTVGPTRGAGSVEGVTFYYDHVFIDEYEKGPDNAPLVMRDAVGVVCR